MSEEAIEDLTYDFLKEEIAAVVTDSSHALYKAELHDHLYHKISDSPGYGIRIGDCESVLAPSPGAAEMEEFDGDLTLVVFVRVVGGDKADRTAARAKVLAISKAVAKLFIEDPTMGNRVNDARVMRCPRGWDSIGSQPYAVCNLPLLVNDSGGQ